MMRFFVLVALVSAVVAFPPVSTREDCPPEGYTAIAGSWKLDKLPPHGKYAICLTAAQAVEVQQDNNNRFDWNWAGVFRLTQSTLVVDKNIRLVANYPAKVDWNGVTVRDLPDEFHLGGGNGLWHGVQLNGAPTNIDASQANYWKNKKIGHCGTLNKVDMDGLDNFFDALRLNNCSSPTKLNEISVFQTRNGADPVVGGEQAGVHVVDSHQLIFTDLTVVGNRDVVEVDRSEAAFLRPTFVSFRNRETALDVEGGSNVTLCDSQLDAFRHIQVGNAEDNGSVAVAGRSNSHFPQDFDFQGNGGVIYTLKKCPPKFASGYELKLWEQWWTGAR